MKKTLLALAMSLAAASGAHAAWNPGVTDDSITGNGELILSVWDSVNKNSYSQDLGITYNQLVSGVGFGTINLDSTALSVFSSANLSTLQFSVMATSNTQYTPSFDYALTKMGLIASLAPGQSKFSIPDADNYNYISGTFGAFTEYGSALGFTTDAATNPVKSVSAGGLGYSEVFELYLENNLARDLSGSNGQTSSLWLQSFADDDGVAQLQRQLGTVTLNISSASAGTLTIAPAVPVPAAVWLLGSALAGLGSIARKRRQAAV